MTVDQMRNDLPATRNAAYLNTGTSGPMPTVAHQAQIDLMERFVQDGFAAPSSMAAYAKALAAARQAVAGLLGCEASDIALTHSASEGMGIVAAGIDWKPGDEVIISDLEHVSGIAPWMRLQDSRGVRVIKASLDGANLSVEAVASALTSKTRLICVSHVSYATGAALPVAELCRLAKARGVLTLVDGAQGAGNVPVNVRALGCDFYALPGQKWLLGPEGTGALYVAPEAMAAIEPTRIGWASLASTDPTRVDHRLSATARRFETGTIHAPAFAALSASIRFLESFGWPQVFERIQFLQRLARARLEAIPQVRVLTPSEAGGLLTFTVQGMEPERLVQALWEGRRTLIRSIPLPRALRASFHAFNTEHEVETLCSAIEEEIHKNRA